MLYFVLLKGLFPLRYFLLDFVFQRAPGWDVAAVKCFLSVFNHELEFRSYPWLICSMQLDGLWGRIRLMASVSWIVNEDARSSTDGLGPRSMNHSCVVAHLPKASIPDRG